MILTLLLIFLTANSESTPSHGISLAQYPSSPKHYNEIKETIFKNYDKTKLPSFTELDIIVVNSITHLSVNEYDNAVNVQGAITLIWMDDRLQWSEEHYGNISEIQIDFDDELVWTPRLKISNLKFENVYPIEPFGAIRITSGGYLKTRMHYNAKIGCEFDFSDFPYDVQNCSISMRLLNEDVMFNPVIFKAALSAINLNIAHGKDKTIISNFKLIEVKLDYYVDLQTTSFILRRHAPFIHAVFIVPSFICLILTLSSFLIKRKDTACYLLFATILIESIFYKNISKKVAPILQSGVIPNLFIYFGMISIASVLALFLNFWALRKKQYNLVH